MGKQKKKRQPKGQRQEKSQQKASLRDKILLAAAIIDLICKVIDFIRGR